MIMAIAALLMGAAPLSLQLDAPQIALQHTCTYAAQPFGWRDASDPLVFAGHPLAWHDQQELAAANLVPLVSVVVDASRLRLFFLGEAAIAQRRLTLRWAGAHTGWTARWPFCSVANL